MATARRSGFTHPATRMPGCGGVVVRRTRFAAELRPTVCNLNGGLPLAVVPDGRRVATIGLVPCTPCLTPPFRPDPRPTTAMAAPTVIARQASLVVSPEDGTSQFGSEYNPVVTGLANGGFVAAWDEFLTTATDADGGVTTVWRTFGGDGKARGKAAQPASGDLSGDFGGLAAAVSFTSGRVALAWDAGNQSRSRVGVQFFNPSTGTAVGEEFTIAAPGRGSGQDILLQGLVPLPGHQAGLMYVDRQELFNTKLRLAVLGSDGRLRSDVELLQQSFPTGPALASLGAPDTVTSLQGRNAGVIAVLTRDPLSNDIGLRFFNTTGRPAFASLTIGNTGGFSPFLTPLANGGVAVIWGAPDSAGGTVYRVVRVNPAGAMRGAPAEIPLPGGFYGSAAGIGLPDGGLLLAATVLASGGAFRSEIAVQRVTANGRRDGGPLTLADPSISYADPQLTRCGDGTVVVAYEDGQQILATRLALSPSRPLRAGPILGDAGTSTLRGSAVDARSDGRAVNDLRLGRDGRDRLTGGDGSDRLQRGRGGDRRRGGVGDDVLTGGAGRDIDTFTPKDRGGVDRLRGWERGDRIAFEALGPVAFRPAGRFPGGEGAAAVRELSASGRPLLQVDSGDADARSIFSNRFDSLVPLGASDFLLA